MTNSITQRIADFLKEYQPFNFLSYDDLNTIANTIRVINLEKHKSLFQINDLLHDCFYVVASGVIHLTVISDAEETLLNKCYSGDIFGLRPFFAKNNYQMTAKAREESIVYAIPISAFKPFVAQNPDVLNFLLESFAVNSKNSLDKQNPGKLMSDTVSYGDNQSDTSYFQSLTYTKTPLKIESKATNKEVAQLMTDNLIDSALIINAGYPIGIVTDADFRSKIATGRYEISATIDKIMSSPVITVTENVSVAEAQLTMLKHNVSHLCVTQDGTDKSDVKGIISEHDLVVAQANNPGILLKQIKKSHSPKDLKQVRDKLTDIIQSSLAKNIPLSHINSISGEITLAIVKRSVELAILDLGSPPARFTWLCIGSQGRKEQLLLSDQDSILVFEDVAADKYRDIKDYFIKLAKKATTTLEKVGFPLSPEGHVASNVLWCKSLTDWVKQYNNWMNTPGENSNEISSVFFDYEMAIGEQKIEDALTENIFKNTKNNALFFDYLGNDALKKPTPLNFFKKFNVEEEGEHKGKFDIKTRALMPLIDSARMLILNANVKGINSTYLRYKQLAINDPKYSEIYLNCAEAFLVLSKFRTLEGLKNDTSGQFINLDELSKIDKEKLKNALTPMKELEDLIKDRFQLTQFS
jgi:CBS domain-containing protein